MRKLLAITVLSVLSIGCESDDYNYLAKNANYEVTAHQPTIQKGDYGTYEHGMVVHVRADGIFDVKGYVEYHTSYGVFYSDVKELQKFVPANEVTNTFLKVVSLNEIPEDISYTAYFRVVD
jgi:hypothetical protein